MSIKVEDLTKAIMKELEDWADVTEEAAFKGLHTTATRAAEKLHSADPSGSGEWGSWAEYNADWKVKSERSNKRGVSQMVVHNAKHYQLTHLLENGHALRNGGRSRAFPHIAPVAEEAERELLDNIKKYIS